MNQSAINGLARQREIFINGAAGLRPRVPADFATLERRVRAKLRPEAFAYIAGGAGRESTVRRNQAAFERWRIVPRVLRDVSERDLSVSLFGRTLPAPFLLAPIGVLELAHQEADLAVARAAAGLGLPFIFSNQASVPMERCAAAMGASPRWFQLYWSRSDELVASLVRRAEAAGCEALVLTLDTTMLGWRTRDLDLAYLPFLEGKGIAQYTSDPAFLRLLGQPPRGSPAGPATKTTVTLRALKTLFLMAAAYPAGFWRGLLSGDARSAVQTFVNIYTRP
ncbi:MAG TPA: alpha-hydroxy-acid oxidizing protein, partial [Herpetosiphonaceae bacterium]